MDEKFKKIETYGDEDSFDLNPFSDTKMEQKDEVQSNLSKPHEKKERVQKPDNTSRQDVRSDMPSQKEKLGRLQLYVPESMVDFFVLYGMKQKKSPSVLLRAVLVSFMKEHSQELSKSDWDSYNLLCK